MKHLALLVACWLPFCTVAQHKITGTMKSAFASVIAYRPSLHVDAKFHFSKNKKSKIKTFGHYSLKGSNRHACACNRRGHRRYEKSKSAIRFAMNVSFDSGKMARR